MSAIPDWPRAFGGPGCSGVIRTEPEDFCIDELPQVEADGSGEHLLLHIEKRNANTDWVAQQLGRFAGVPRKDVSYAGLKDRRAVARQWFSLRLAGRPEPDWSRLASNEFSVLESRRHGRKLRPGTLKGNRFEIRVRSLTGDTAGLESILEQIGTRGIPNYFGEQRFGRDGANLDAAVAMFSGRGGRLSRHKRGIYLSAARSRIFNEVLASRVKRQSWEMALPGERLVLNGSRNSFLREPGDAAIEARLLAMDIHPSGPLWGQGTPPVEAAVAGLEAQAAASLAGLRDGLSGGALKHERRALRAAVSDLQWVLDGDRLQLNFSLPKGSYATALLREIVDYRVAG